MLRTWKERRKLERVAGKLCPDWILESEADGASTGSLLLHHRRRTVLPGTWYVVRNRKATVVHNILLLSFKPQRSPSDIPPESEAGPVQDTCTV